MKRAAVIVVAWVFTFGVLALSFTGLYALGLWALTWGAFDWIVASASAAATLLTLLWAVDVWDDL